MFDPSVLDDLDPDVKRTILNFLRTVVEHPDTNLNVVRYQALHGGEWQYSLGSKGNNSAVVNLIRHRTNVIPMLRANGWLESAPPPYPDGAHAFTSAAQQWHRDNKYSDTDIQRKVGLLLLESLETVGAAMAKSQRHDLDAWSTNLGVPVDRILRNVQRLKAMAYVEGSGTYDAPIDQGYFGLTSPVGVTWANAGAQPISAIGTTTVNVEVNLHVEITNTIKQARRSDVDPDLLVRWEGLMRRLEEELEKPAGEGSFQVAMDVIQTAEASKGLLGPTVKFFGEHWDRISSLIEAAADGIQGLM